MPIPEGTETDDIDEIVQDCERCVQYYEDNPGVHSHRTIIDIYNTIARLARLVDIKTRVEEEATPEDAA